jgi:hypothetical protein
MKQKDRDRLATMRRALISKMVDRGESFPEIGRIFRISGSRVRQIYDRGKELERKKRGRTMPELSNRAYEAVKTVTGHRSPTLIDLSRFIGENPGWKERLYFTPRCGPKTISEIEDFAKANGILKG